MGKEFDTKLKIEKFAEEFSHELYEIKRFVKFLNIDKSYKKKLNSSLKILNKKLKKIKKSKSIKDASDVIKISKLKKKFGDNSV